ncbi:MAG: hypothetical protein ACK5C0_01940 [Candidatus Kapaibacterium sp.]|jgi:hypothetical protein
MTKSKEIKLLLTWVTVAQIIGDFLAKLGSTSGGGLYSNKYLTHCLYSGIVKFPLFMFGWISKVL